MTGSKTGQPYSSMAGNMAVVSHKHNDTAVLLAKAPVYSLAGSSPCVGL